MTTRKADNDSERFARIEALMEEYRVKHQDLEAYVDATRDRARIDRARSQQAIVTARAAFHRRTNRR